jgi:hypothetical protein
MSFGSALITGASSGIGAALARRLVAAGTRELCLVARRRERLEQLAAELAGASAQIEVADLTRPADVGRLAARIRAQPPDLLVNNAGAGLYGRFEELDCAAQLGTIDLNVRALVELTHAYIGAVRARDHGTVLQVASTAGFAPIPYEAVYAATKSFVIAFSEALAEELRATRLRIVTLCPGFTETEFLDAAGLPDRVVLQRGTSADEVAATALAALAGSGSRTIVHGAATRVAAALGRAAPRAWVVRGVGAWMRRGIAPRGPR